MTYSVLLCLTPDEFSCLVKMKVLALNGLNKKNETDPSSIQAHRKLFMHINMQDSRPRRVKSSGVVGQSEITMYSRVHLGAMYGLTRHIGR